MRAKLFRLRFLFRVFVLLLLAIYAVAAVRQALDDGSVGPVAGVSPSLSIAIFGASGTAGDGILKAALDSPDIASITIVTRRVTPRMKAAVESGNAVVFEHTDYLDYAAVIEELAEVDAVYWAIGISSLGVDEETYGLIHVDFPLAFVEQWEQVARSGNPSFHYISSSDISEDSRAMWAREKVRAENALFEFAENAPLRVIAYRPDYIGPTKEEAHLGQDLLYGFFAPVGAAVRALQIGQSMIDVTLRGDAFVNGSRLNTRKIILHSDSYEERLLSIRNGR